MPIFAIADDLSGAAETACALREGAGYADLLIDPSVPRRESGATRSVVIDTDCRRVSEDEADRRFQSALALAAPSDVVMMKVDSLLRGHIAAAVRAALPRGVVMSPALPAQGRLVHGGVMLVGDLPLSSTDAWRHENGHAPCSVSDVLGELPIERVPLGVVRRVPELQAAIIRAVGTGRIAICDATEQADLDSIAAAALTLAAPPVMVGTAALAAALAAISGPPPRSIPARPAREGVPLLAVVGTAEPSAARQLAVLDARLPVVRVAGDELFGDPAAVAGRVDHALATGVAALTMRPGLVAGSVSRGLADVVRRLACTPDLLLIGGETARCALDALSVSQLNVDGPLTRSDGAIEYGVAHMHTACGRVILTRPGSFGDDEAIAVTIAALRGSTHQGKGT